jgi:hypothetical protein
MIFTAWDPNKATGTNSNDIVEEIKAVGHD